MTSFCYLSDNIELHGGRKRLCTMSTSTLSMLLTKLSLIRHTYMHTMQYWWKMSNLKQTVTQMSLTHFANQSPTNNEGPSILCSKNFLPQF